MPDSLQNPNWFTSAVTNGSHGRHRRRTTAEHWKANSSLGLRGGEGPVSHPTYTMSPSAAMPSSCCVPQTPQTFSACQVTLSASC